MALAHAASAESKRDVQLLWTMGLNAHQVLVPLARQTDVKRDPELISLTLVRNDCNHATVSSHAARTLHAALPET